MRKLLLQSSDADAFEKQMIKKAQLNDKNVLLWDSTLQDDNYPYQWLAEFIFSLGPEEKSSH